MSIKRFTFGDKDNSLEAAVSDHAQRHDNTFNDSCRYLLKLGLKAEAAGFFSPSIDYSGLAQREHARNDSRVTTEKLIKQGKK